MFPGATVALFGDTVLAQITQPATQVGRSTNTLVAGFTDAANDAEKSAAQAAFLDQVSALVGNGDYAAGRRIQQGMRSGAQSGIVFGKNERGLIYLNEALDARLAPRAAAQ